MATSTDTLRLILETEMLLFERLDVTADPAEKQSLRAQIEELGQIRARAVLDDTLQRANTLNALSDTLTGAIAGVRTQPLNGIARRIEDLLDQVGFSLADTAANVRGALSVDEAEATPAVPAMLPGVALALAGETAAPLAQPAPAAPAPAVPEFEVLAKEYEELFGSCAVRPERSQELRRITARLAANSAIYEEAAAVAGGSIPWYFVGIIHALESSFSFSTHLHNGDPLTGHTTRVPAGHPRTGSPPFSWKDSAADALRLKKFHLEADWSLPKLLERWERYNGWGYRKRGIRSPYLWSFSTHYAKGKFVADGRYDPEAVSSQCGAAVLLWQLLQDGTVSIDRKSNTLSAEAALGARGAVLPPQAKSALPAYVRAELDLPGEIAEGNRKKDAVRRVQEWCTLHGSGTKVDGDFGTGTRDAVRDFQLARGLLGTGAVDERTWAALTAPMHRALAPLQDATAGLHGTVIAVARQHLKEHPREAGGDNRGPWVRLYMAGKEGSDQAWCAGFVCFLLQQAALVLGQPMPIRRQVGVDALVADAKRDGRFVAGDSLRSPEARMSRLPAGSLFVIRSTTNPNDWIHTGLVAEARGDSFLTIEGNTNSDGSRNGFEATTRSRSYKQADFVLIA
ncbi:peptidoglycan-binding protein [Sabulicella glaciei]|uniref:Peptidoglycan-binding protein n=1 Tax=Sabulicella glaciei TaxID=2984948 RepID=A0ABT3NSZ7_9PROT|nr:peptidoglycan-binding protein [Roseococcus sp. MDT2-1-1]MCW8085276.1 peptidoglycan-binding protein [Roseococcus sp. MDT2-1-1]